MVAFIGILLLGFLGKTNNRQVDLFIPVASPVLYFAILLGTIFFFFVSKISLLAVVIPFVLIYAVAIISLILACFYQDHLKNVPHKEVEIIDFNGLKEYLMMLQTKTTNEIANKKINNILDKLASLNADGEEALAANAKRIFEYAQFMKKDLENNEINNFLMNASSLEKLLDGVNK
jgi:hypothetical protein